MPSLPFDESANFSPPPAFGPYRVLHQIGSGVLGPVFRTYDPQRDRLVAVKAFRLDLVPEDVARLADGLRRLVAMQAQMPAAANVAALTEGGLEGTVAFLAMDYIAAETLDVAIRHLAPAPLDTALPILAGIAAAIDAAWAADPSLGHGALHPRDVFLTPGADDLRVTGFGIAPALEAISAKAPIRRPYTAPERAAGGAWDIRADVYSLGAIAHELLTGRRPAGAGEQDGSLPASYAPEARVHVRKVLSAALAEHPSHRFATATAFVEALKDKSVELPVVSPEQPEQPDQPAAQVDQVDQVGLVDQVARVAQAAEVHEFDLTSVVSPAREPEVDADVVTAPVTPRTPRARRAVPPAPLQPAAEEPLPELELAPVPARSPFVDLDPNPRARTYVAQPAVALPPPFPWAVVVAVLVAGVVIGAVGMYQWLLPRLGPPAATQTAKTATAPGKSAAAPKSPAASDTEVAVTEPNQPPAKTPEPGAKAPAPGPQAPEQIGRLLIQSTPAGALVTVDGKSAGRSPATVRDLVLGPHTVVVSRPGYVSETRRVTITNRAAAQRVSVTLKAAAAASKGAPAQTATTGTIVIESRPRGASVMIDGNTVGVSPLRLPGYAPGIHRVQLTLDGHWPISTVVSVKAGEAARLAVTLERK